jgi:hypothetical protein
MIGRCSASQDQPAMHMVSFIFRLSERFGRFERWFNEHFGWFFTNGMKVPVIKDGRTRSSPP